MSIQTLETPPLAATKIVRPSLLKRIRHSDMWWSFTHNKTAMASAALLAILILTAIFAPLIAPQNPYDGAQLDMWQAELPPIWEDRGEWPFLLGTDTQGRDMLSAILYGTDLDRDRHRIRCIVVADRDVGRARVRFLWWLYRQLPDAHRRHHAFDTNDSCRHSCLDHCPPDATAGPSRSGSRCRTHPCDCALGLGSICPHCARAGDC